MTDWLATPQATQVGSVGSALSAEVLPEHGVGGAVPAVVDFDDLAALYEQHFDYVWRSLRRLGVAPRDQEDLAHEVFLSYFRTRAGFDRSRPLRPWLFGIAFRVASDFRRLARNRLEVPEGPSFMDPVDQTPDAEAQAVAAERRRLVLAALDGLSLEQRAVLVMHDIDGHSMPEIALALDVPLNTLYSRLRLGRAEFAKVVRRLTTVRSVK